MFEVACILLFQLVFESFIKKWEIKRYKCALISNDKIFIRVITYFKLFFLHVLIL